MVLDFAEKEKFEFFWAVLKFLNLTTVLQVLPFSLYQITLLQQMTIGSLTFSAFFNTNRLLITISK